jgi:hypothetical membrane protein
MEATRSLVEDLMVSGAQHAASDERKMRLAAQGGVLGPVIFFTVVLLGGTLSDGYSHSSQKISELGGQGAEFAALQNANFILLGILVLGFAWALARAMGPPHTGPVLLGVFGVSSCIANGLLPCDVACVGETPVAQAHNITGLVGFLAAIAGMILLARRWRHDPRWRDHAGHTVGAVVVAIGGLIWFVITQATDPLHPLGGIAQRTFVAALLLWIARTAWLLQRELTVTGQEPALQRPATG